MQETPLQNTQVRSAPGGVAAGLPESRGAEAPVQPETQPQLGSNLDTQLPVKVFMAAVRKALELHTGHHPGKVAKLLQKHTFNSASVRAFYEKTAELGIEPGTAMQALDTVLAMKKRIDELQKRKAELGLPPTATVQHVEREAAVETIRQKLFRPTLEGTFADRLVLDAIHKRGNPLFPLDCQTISSGCFGEKKAPFPLSLLGKNELNLDEIVSPQLKLLKEQLISKGVCLSFTPLADGVVVMKPFFPHY